MKISYLNPPREHGDGGSFVNEYAKYAPFGGPFEHQIALGTLAAGSAQDIPVTALSPVLPLGVKAGIKRAWLVFVALLTVKTTVPANGTNFTTLEIISKGSDGLGTDVVASLTTNSSGGSTLTAFRPTLIAPQEGYQHELLAEALVKIEVPVSTSWEVPSPVLSFKKTEDGSGAALANALLTLRGAWEFEV